MGKVFVDLDHIGLKASYVFAGVNQSLFTKEKFQCIKIQLALLSFPILFVQQYSVVFLGKSIFINSFNTKDETKSLKTTNFYFLKLLCSSSVKIFCLCVCVCGQQIILKISLEIICLISLKTKQLLINILDIFLTILYTI